MTAVDATNYQFCPAGYVGVARRRCKSSVEELPDVDVIAAASRVVWSWDEPDFAHCSDRYINDLYKKMKLVALGYVVVDVPSVYNQFGDFIHAKLKLIDETNRLNPKRATRAEQIPFPYLPGEGNALLEMAKILEAFVWSNKTHVLPPSFWNSTAVDYLYALDALLSMPTDYFRPDVSVSFYLPKHQGEKEGVLFICLFILLQGGVPILRLIQNHLTLLANNPKEGYPLGAIQSHLLNNSNIDTVFNR